MNPARLIRILALVTALAAAAIAGPGGTVNGIAVSVHYHWNGAPQYSGCFNYRGDLMKYTITNGSVTNTQTLVSRATGLVQYPSIDLNGTMVAFYRWGQRVNAQGTVTNTSDLCHVSVVSLSTGIVTDLVELPTAYIQQGPALNLQYVNGELWVYYVLPTAGDWECSWGRASHEIRRVKVSDHTDQLVQHLVDSEYGTMYDNLPSSCCSDAGGQIIRFEMNAKGDRAAVKGCMSGNTNSVYPFPLLNKNACGTNGVGGTGSCNIGCSASGFYCTGYGGGWHTDLQIGKCSGAPASPALRSVDSYGTGHFILSEAAALAGTATPAGAEWPLWSCNSDKWVCQQVGWVAHAGDLKFGSNQLLENWADNKAIMTSNNPAQDKTANVTFEDNCSGDFWVNNTAHPGCYEAADGSWVVASPQSPVVEPASGIKRASVVSAQALFSLQGRRVAASTTGHSTPRGAYVSRSEGIAGIAVQRCVLQ